jgi:hypothetical protein
MNFKTPHALIMIFLDFLDQWIKLLLSLVLKQSISQTSKFPENPSSPYPPRQRVSTGQCPTGRVQGYLNP